MSEMEKDYRTTDGFERFFRKQKRKTGGRNWDKTRRQLARHHEKVHHCRQDMLHKLSTKWKRGIAIFADEPDVQRMRTIESGSKGTFGSRVEMLELPYRA